MALQTPKRGACPGTRVLALEASDVDYVQPRNPPQPRLRADPMRPAGIAADIRERHGVLREDFNALDFLGYRSRAAERRRTGLALRSSGPRSGG